MTSYEIFVFIICLIVFILFTATSGLMVYHLVKDRIKLINYGDMDADIIKEYEESKKHNNKKYLIVSYIVNAVISLIFVAVFTFSLVVNMREDSFSYNTPTLRAVLSDSMSKKLDGNDYLTVNGIDNQFQMYDMILTYKVPDEFELKLYDVVVYEVDEKLIVHRIVAIEEPNALHPNHRHFTLQGDAVGNIDRYPVLYSQMRGIYRGEKIPFLGGFVKFLQSPAGWLCLILLVGTTVLSPLIDKRIEEQKMLRLLEIGYITSSDNEDEEDETEISYEEIADESHSENKL